MGSIPVAGANARSAFSADLLHWYPHKNPSLRKAQNWVRIFGAEHPSVYETVASRKIFTVGEIPVRFDEVCPFIHGEKILQQTARLMTLPFVV